jgi:hypothetical protein
MATRNTNTNFAYKTFKINTAMATRQHGSMATLKIKVEHKQKHKQERTRV